MESDRRKNPILQKLLYNYVDYFFFEDYDPILYRTRRLNQMIDNITSPIVAIWDVDIIVPPLQVLSAVKLIRKDSCDFAYPYQKYFLDVPSIIKHAFLETKDITILQKNMSRMPQLYEPDPCGGAFICNTEKYKESGLENEHFYGWGIEDGERIIRWKRLGYRIERVDGPLYHLSHPRGENSSDSKQKGLLKDIKLRAYFKSHNYNGSISYEK
ncbi:MAG: galactosyltransferase-related protein [Bacteroidaceae bacterium]